MLELAINFLLSYVSPIMSSGGTARQFNFDFAFESKGGGWSIMVICTALPWRVFAT